MYVNNEFFPIQTLDQILHIFFLPTQNEELSSNSSNDSQPNNNTLELSFEYLMSKNCLKWITISSEQAMLMSVCLQSVVDELLNQKDGADTNNIQVRLNFPCATP